MRIILFLLWLFLPVAAFAQSEAEDRGFLQGLLEDTLSSAGREVRIEGFAGALSSRATIARLTIADDRGIWLTLNQVVLDWSRSALLRGQLSVSELTAAEIVLDRLPQGETPAAPSPEAAEFALPDLPVSVEIGRVAAPRLVLGQAVIGTPVVASVEAAGTLAGGKGQAQLLATRTDDTKGRITLAASYSNQSRILALDLDLTEAQGGIVTRLLDLPGTPPLDLTVKGTGPVTDYAADIRLATDGQDRLAGRVTVQGDGASGRDFTARVGGNVMPLFLPAYADFFGPDVRLDVAGTRATDGRLSLNRLLLTTQALRLDGSLTLAADGLPERIALQGTLAAADGQPVLLPLSGPPTRVGRAGLTIRYDATTGDRWTASAELSDLNRPEFSAAHLVLDGAGRIARNAGAATVDGALSYAAQGLRPADAALAAALGPEIGGRARFVWSQASDGLTLPEVTLDGQDYGLTSALSLSGLSSGFAASGTGAVRFQDLSRFAGLAGRPLQGRGNAEIAGSVALLGGAFDATGTINGTDLAIGQAEVDNLLTGDSRVTFSVLRDTGGTRLRDLTVTARRLSATASGTVATAGSELTADLAFTDLSDLGPGFGGALTARATLLGTADNARVTAEAVGRGLRVGQAQADRLLAGETRLTATVRLDRGRIGIESAVLRNPQLSLNARGTEGGAGRGFALDARLGNLALVAPQFPGPLTVTGTALPGPEGYRIDLRAQGPGGIDLRAKGAAAPNFSSVNIAATGSAQAALAGPFIQPRTISGPVRFDLRLNGRPSLGALSGRVTLVNGRLADPGFGLAVEALEGAGTLSDGRVQVDVSGRPANGGRIAVAGSVGLAPPLSADLAIDITRAVLRDPELYRTTADGRVTVTGPLTGGARIAGRIALDETEIRIPSTGFGGASGLDGLRHLNEPAPVHTTRARARMIPGEGGARSGGPRRPFPLDLVISAPDRIFIRGRGLDAELGGELRLAGTTANVVPSGAFNLIRGRLDILGKRLTLNEAQLQLEGDFVPYVRVLASTENDGITASVRLQGRANEPEVSFTSVPDLPQEEVLSRLLFGRGLDTISPLQAAQLAGAVATLAGRGGEGVIGRLRQGFGLDDLDVATDAEGSASVRAGKYVSDNVYTQVEVDQQGQSRINLNLDVRPGVTLRGSAGSSGNTSLGIFIERDY